MTQYRRARPNQEIRNLKEWGPGRHSQLRLFVSHLEQAFNGSLAAQVSQSNKRVFSQFVPKIVDQDITTEVEYREVRIAWVAPKGLRNFLFYEAQISATSNFSNFDSFITYDPFFVFPNLLDGRTYYIRLRVLTKDEQFGPWSNNIEATLPFSQAYGFFDGTERVAPVFNNESFQTVFVREYESIGGEGYYSVDYELEPIINTTSSANIEWSDVELQWIVDGDQVGQNFLVTVYGVNSIADAPLTPNLEAITADIGNFTEPNALLLPGPFILNRRGTFVQKFTSIAQGTRTIELRARVFNSHPTPNDWIFNDGNTTNDEGDEARCDVTYGVGATLRTKNFNIFEALTS